MKFQKDEILMFALLAVMFVLSSFVTGCGSDESTDQSQQIPSVETASDIPDFSHGWSREPGATDKCFQADLGTGNVNCQTEFTADDENCGNATFKFVSIKDGYMHVQTKINIIVRQGEFHQLNFDEKAEVYNVTDKYTEQYYHVFKCIGPGI